MTAMPHQRYSELMDEDTYLSVLQFHSRCNYTIAPGISDNAYLTSIRDSELELLIKRDLCFYPGSDQISITPDTHVDRDIRRSSGLNFTDKHPLPFSLIASLVRQGLAAQGDEKRMPYPSGGALYSVQAFLCKTSDMVTDWPSQSSVLHILPFSNAFESMRVGCSSKQLLEMLSGGDTARLGTPHFAIFYAMSIDKAIFKYRHRGYRLAVAESGAMFQTMTKIAQSSALETRVWAGFNDFHVASTLGIDNTHVLPLLVQFFGKI